MPLTTLTTLTTWGTEPTTTTSNVFILFLKLLWRIKRRTVFCINICHFYSLFKFFGGVAKIFYWNLSFPVCRSKEWGIKNQWHLDGRLICMIFFVFCHTLQFLILFCYIPKVTTELPHEIYKYLTES